MQRIATSDVSGVWAIMPTPATEDASDPSVLDSVDRDETRRATDALITDGVDAIMTNGTFGEGATLTWDELIGFATTVIDEAAGRVPVIVGATTLNTRDTITRARALRDAGASGLLLGRPMWSPCDDVAIIDFYRHVADAVPELAIVVYDNPVSFRGKLSANVYAQLARIPQVIAAKYPILGPAFLSDLDAVGDSVRLLPVERDWYAAWKSAPTAILACWSGSASCGPAPAIALRDAIRGGRVDDAEEISAAYLHASQPFFPEGSFEIFSTYNVQLEKIRIDEAGYMKAGPSRPPYVSCPEDYAAGARESGRRLAELHLRYVGAGAAS